MEIWQAIVLGAVQGFAEFLPVSSSGHLMLLQYWFGIEEAFFYSVMLHIGTLIPVVVVLWKEIVSLFKKPFNKMLYLIIATVPAGIVGLICSKVIDIDTFFSTHIYLLGLTFIFTAAELFFAEKRAKKVELINPINPKTALYMGLGQAVGVLPGISRSGSTITGGTMARVDRESNASFTFLMSIPIILAAVLLESYDVYKAGLGDINVTALLFGILSAMVCGYIAIKFMLNVIKKANYKWFSLYLVILGILTLVTYIF